MFQVRKEDPQYRRYDLVRKKDLPQKMCANFTRKIKEKII